MAIAPALGLALAVAGIGLGVVGAIQRGQSEEKAALYQSGVAQKNREINLVNAREAVARSQREAQQVDQQNRALYGSQVAAQAASGLKIGGRSQILTRKSARELGRRDVLNVIHAGEVEAYNFKVAAENADAEAGFLKDQAKDSVLASWLDAGSVLVGGLSSAAFQVPGKSTLGSVKTYKPKYIG